MISTWEMMEKYNLPVSGSKIRVTSHLDAYITVGRVYIVGWSCDRSSPSYISMTSEHGGTHVSHWQFRDCEWEYFYEDERSLKWPRAQRRVAA